MTTHGELQAGAQRNKVHNEQAAIGFRLEQRRSFRRRSNAADAHRLGTSVDTPEKAWLDNAEPALLNHGAGKNATDWGGEWRCAREEGRRIIAASQPASGAIAD